METITNTKVPLSRNETQYYTCSHTEERTGSGGSNVIYKARSSTVNNPKDAYGFRPMSPFEGIEEERRQPTGTREMYSTSGGCDGLVNRCHGPIPSGIEYWFRAQVYRDSVAGGQTHDLLAMRAEADLKQQDINVLQFAAFLPSTLKNIYDNFMKLDEMLNLLHDRKKLKRVLKKEDPRSLYLQWLFVWNQLYRDIVGGVRFIMSKSRPIGSLVTGRASNTSENEEVVSKMPYAYDYVGLATCTTRMSLSQRAVSVARVTSEISYTSNKLGLSNPAYLAWDLVKWSWVTDQIVDIGLFISSITSLHGLEFLGTSITDRVVNETTVTVESFERSGYSYQCSYAPGFSRRKHVKRIVRPNPTKTITFRNPFQTNVMIAAAAASALSMKAVKSKSALDRLARSARLY